MCSVKTCSHYLMVFKPVKFFHTLNLILLLSSTQVYAQETSSIPVELTLETPMAPAGTNEMTLDVDEQQVETLEQEYALNGYSLGLAFLNQNFNVDAKVLIDEKSTLNLSSQSSDFQSAGIVGRYVILPFNKIGTDVNVSVASSVNHGSVGFSSITSLKAELNLGYAIKLSQTPVYFLGGVGYELIYGNDIQKILSHGGGTVQIGVGIGIGKKFNVELFYCYAKHDVSTTFKENAQNIAIQSGAKSGRFLTQTVTSNIIESKLTYSY